MGSFAVFGGTGAAVCGSRVTAAGASSWTLLSEVRCPTFDGEGEGELVPLAVKLLHASALLDDMLGVNALTGLVAAAAGDKGPGSAGGRAVCKQMGEVRRRSTTSTCSRPCTLRTRWRTCCPRRRRR